MIFEKIASGHFTSSFTAPDRNKTLHIVDALLSHDCVTEMCEGCERECLIFLSLSDRFITTYMNGSDLLIRGLGVCYFEHAPNASDVFSEFVVPEDVGVFIKNLIRDVSPLIPAVAVLMHVVLTHENGEHEDGEHEDGKRKLDFSVFMGEHHARFVFLGKEEID